MIFRVKITTITVVLLSSDHFFSKEECSFPTENHVILQLLLTTPEVRRI